MKPAKIARFVGVGRCEGALIEARLAQSVEHQSLNLVVVGSSPTLGALKAVRLFLSPPRRDESVGALAGAPHTPRCGVCLFCPRLQFHAPCWCWPIAG